MTSVQRRPTVVIPAKMDFGSGAVPFSPLDQLGLMKLGGQPLSPLATIMVDPMAQATPLTADTTNTTTNPSPGNLSSITAADPSESSTPAPPTIPALDFKLFRSPSIYSVESGDAISLNTEEAHERFGHSDDGESDSTSDSDAPLDDSEFYTPEDEKDVITFSTPSTPRAWRTKGAHGTGSPASPISGAATPIAARTITEHHRVDAERSRSGSPPNAFAHGPLRSAVSQAPFALRAVPVRTARSTSYSASSSPTSPQPIRATTLDAAPRESQTGAGSPTAAPVHAVHQTAPSPRYPERAVAPDWASVHGEQGSDWGDDENGFEWLDSSDAPDAETLNGQGPSQQGQRRLVRGLTRRLSAVGVKAANTAAGLVTGKDTTSDSVASRPVAPAATVATEPLSRSSDSGHASATVYSSSSSMDGNTPAMPERRRTKKKRSYVIPRRAPPPPPPGGGITIIPVEASRSRSPGKPQAGGAADRSSPCPDGSLSVTTPTNKQRQHEAVTNTGQSSAGDEAQALPPVVVIAATPPRPGPGQEPVMTPYNDHSSASTSTSTLMHKSASHQSAFSYYDMDGTESPSRASDLAGSGAGTFPRGKYARVPLHELNGTPPSGAGKSPIHTESGSRHARRPSADDALSGTSSYRRPLRSVDSSTTLRQPSHSKRVPTMAEADLMSPDELVAAGLQRREAGDKPKSTWFFMKAAEVGSVTGQIHWGIALRHGLGIGRDERRGFSELSQAIDRALSEGVVDLRAAVGSLLSPTTARAMPRDLSVGLFELSNCYFDGSGTRRQPELAIEYLRMAGSLGDLAAQEQLGLILSKGLNGVKKDTREAAKWYRAAIGSGSNTPGLAWVWKDKYNDVS